MAEKSSVWKIGSPVNIIGVLSVPGVVETGKGALFKVDSDFREKDIFATRARIVLLAFRKGAAVTEELEDLCMGRKGAGFSFRGCSPTSWFPYL